MANSLKFTFTDSNGEKFSENISGTSALTDANVRLVFPSIQNLIDGTLVKADKTITTEIYAEPEGE